MSEFGDKTAPKAAGPVFAKPVKPPEPPPPIVAEAPAVVPAPPEPAKPVSPPQVRKEPATRKPARPETKIHKPGSPKRVTPATQTERTVKPETPVPPTAPKAAAVEERPVFSLAGAPKASAGPTALVMFAISPWGEIFLDGKSAGVSPPLSELELPPGRHRIEIRNGSFKPYLETYELEANQTVRIKYKFKER
jgi:hypothetical protein